MNVDYAPHHRQQSRETAARILVLCTLALLGIDILAGIIRTAPPGPQLERRTVIVQPGDSLWSIWRRETDEVLNWGSWRERTIAENSLGPYLQPGQKLVVVGILREETTDGYTEPGGSNEPDEAAAGSDDRADLAYRDARR